MWGNSPRASEMIRVAALGAHTLPALTQLGGGKNKLYAFNTTTPTFIYKTSISLIITIYSTMALYTNMLSYSKISVNNMQYHPTGYCATAPVLTFKSPLSKYFMFIVIITGSKRQVHNHMLLAKGAWRIVRSAWGKFKLAVTHLQFLGETSGHWASLAHSNLFVGQAPSPLWAVGLNSFFFNAPSIMCLVRFQKQIIIIASHQTFSTYNMEYDDSATALAMKGSV